MQLIATLFFIAGLAMLACVVAISAIMPRQWAPGEKRCTDCGHAHKGRCRIKHRTVRRESSACRDYGARFTGWWMFAG